IRKERECVGHPAAFSGSGLRTPRRRATSSAFTRSAWTGEGARPHTSAIILLALRHRSRHRQRGCGLRRRASACSRAERLRAWGCTPRLEAGTPSRDRRLRRALPPFFFGKASSLLLF